MEYGEQLPEHFGQHELGLPARALSGYGIGKGQAWVIDCLAKTMIKLFPAVV
jgi:hypothetical protein